MECEPVSFPNCIFPLPIVFHFLSISQSRIPELLVLRCENCCNGSIILFSASLILFLFTRSGGRGLLLWFIFYLDGFLFPSCQHSVVEDLNLSSSSPVTGNWSKQVNSWERHRRLRRSNSQAGKGLGKEAQKTRFIHFPNPSLFCPWQKV